MKKFLALALAALMAVLTLASCSESAATVKVIDIPLSEESYAFAVSKEDTELLAKVNAALDKALENDYYTGWYEACQIYSGISTIDELGYDENGNKIVE